ncbi:MAG TPA: VWA domain-containing protein [Candidatus Acidoferrum sp.]|nr:VWA domain-containing protein [Candidatus Acidoferrum sp.]
MNRFTPAIKLFLVACAALLICAGVAVRARGQSTTPATPSASSATLQNVPPPIRSVSRLVQLNVIVEKKGKPVTGLTKGDFTILDQNQPQKISSFAEVAYDPSKVPMQAAGVAAETQGYTNRYAGEGGIPPSITVILLDALNTPPQELVNARAEIKDFLHQLQPRDRVALYGLSTQLYVIHGFSNDAASLLQALDKSKSPPVFEPSASEITPSDSGNENLDAFLDTMNQHAADLQTLNKVEFTANVMAAIANSLMDIPGRKNLIWVSGGFPFKIGSGTVMDDPAAGNKVGAPGPDNSVAFRTFQKEIEAAAEAVNNANLAIYPVDARGLIGASNFTATTSAAPSQRTSTPRSRRPIASQMPTPPRENFDTMNELADRTGGRAFYNSNDIQGSIRRAIDDSRDTYVLEYYPAGVDWDGTFHTIKVEVKQEGVSVRTRGGYFASHDPAADPMRVEQKIQDALSSPFLDSELLMTVEAVPPGATDTNRWIVNVIVDPARVRFHPAGDNWADDFEILCAQFSADGKPIAGNKQVESLNLPPRAYEEAMKIGVSLTRQVDLRINAAKLRVVVHDVGTGMVGSVDIPLNKK